MTTGTKASAEAQQYVNATYTEGVASYLLAGDGFRVQDPVSGERTGPVWKATFEELAGLGFMRRSKTGRYWWA